MDKKDKKDKKEKKEKKEKKKKHERAISEDNVVTDRRIKIDTKRVNQNLRGSVVDVVSNCRSTTEHLKGATQLPSVCLKQATDNKSSSNNSIKYVVKIKNDALSKQMASMYNSSKYSAKNEPIKEVNEDAVKETTRSRAKKVQDEDAEYYDEEDDGGYGDQYDQTGA